MIYEVSPRLARATLLDSDQNQRGGIITRRHSQAKASKQRQVWFYLICQKRFGELPSLGLKMVSIHVTQHYLPPHTTAIPLQISLPNSAGLIPPFWKWRKEIWEFLCLSDPIFSDLLFLFFINRNNFFLVFYCVWGQRCSCVTVLVRGQRTTYGSPFSLSTVWAF